MWVCVGVVCRCGCGVGGCAWVCVGGSVCMAMFVCVCFHVRT